MVEVTLKNGLTVVINIDHILYVRKAGRAVKERGFGQTYRS